jgi:hypothetical protein
MLKEVLDNNPVTTILTCLTTAIVVGVGGAIAILHPETLSFTEYVTDVGIGAGGSAAGFGVLGIARSAAGKG